MRYKPTLFCSPLVKPEPTWLRPEKLTFEEKEEEEEERKKKKKRKKGGVEGGGGKKKKKKMKKGHLLFK